MASKNWFGGHKERQSNIPNLSQRTPIERFHKELDNLFENFFNGYNLSPFGQMEMPSLNLITQPKVNISETDTNFIVVAEVPGVVEVHQLRTRSMGRRILVDVHVIVAPKLTVSEGHYISEQVQYTLIKQIQDVTDVIVHIDPEDDEVHPTNPHLPSRESLVPLLKEKWQSLPGGNAIQEVLLHYLSGALHIEVKLPFGTVQHEKDAKDLTLKFKTAVQEVAPVASLHLIFS